MFNIFSSASEEPPSIPQTDFSPSFNNVDEAVSSYDEVVETKKNPAVKETIENEKLDLVSSPKTKDGNKRPTLKIGIVLPKQIFQQRRYQVFDGYFSNKNFAWNWKFLEMLWQIFLTLPDSHRRRHLITLKGSPEPKCNCWHWDLSFKLFSRKFKHLQIYQIFVSRVKSFS